MSTPSRNFFFPAAPAARRRHTWKTTAPQRLKMPSTPRADMRLKKNIGKTRFFFSDVARVALEGDAAACTASASSSVRTA
ncbi:hypothetical protein [Pseudoxanthomonas sp. PXM02]|uniref:hypothetical protein n=1 Tax=Pseudoxanthomonas sp. PXM02 TaxID=2769294 RepID=UPI0017815CAB|nr:hypothetical protein [Pseudoxanthomonas sp. PXM02]MBD9479461.1 hypothetical protein [Pseudoxanthomonas sp. PXM02]